MSVHIGAAALAAAMTGIGVLSIFTAARPALLKAWLGNVPDERQYAASRTALRGQGHVLFLSSGVTALVAIGPSLGVTGGAAMLVVTALLAAQIAMIGRLHRSGEPFIRQILGDTASATFWIAIVALFLWSAAERFIGAPRLEALDLVVAAMAVHGAIVMRAIVRRLR